jgi:hypothetical protein
MDLKGSGVRMSDILCRPKTSVNPCGGVRQRIGSP